MKAAEARTDLAARYGLEVAVDDPEVYDLVIGTLPKEQRRAIFQTLVDEYERGEDTFMEGWIES